MFYGKQRSNTVNDSLFSIRKDKSLREVLSSGKSNAPIQDKTVSIYYGCDFLNVQCVNFVSMSDEPVDAAKVEHNAFVLSYC